jgi:LuxR family maltose regulon positive regulatory protein
MNQGPHPIAKITRPGAAGIVLRERLFSRLDKGREKPVFWVTAPGGSGKTSLVASWLESRAIPGIWYQVDSGDSDLATFFYYLGQAEARMNRQELPLLPLFTPEYLQDVQRFTRRYFEELYLRMARHGRSAPPSPHPSALVLDNYQEIPPDSPFHDMLRHGLDALPEGVIVVIISRTGPPPQLARLRANSRMTLLGWSEVRFTLDESGEILAGQGLDGVRRELVESLHTRADGWAAGLILMTERLRLEEQGARLTADHTPQEMFDYFASEIFQRTPPETQRFLLTTSFFPALTAAMAERLTGMREAGGMLADLSRNHYFTDWRPGTAPVYQYHPLFKDFLRAQARNFFTTEELSVILRNTAALLLENDCRAEAVELLAESRDVDGIARVVIESAQSLIEQGRNRTLQHWFSYLPPEAFESDPWLSYWQGVAIHPFDSRASEQAYNTAFDAFNRDGNTAGALLAWAGIVVNVYAEWNDFSRLDPLIAWLTVDVEQQVDALPEDLRARISGVILLCFTFRQPWHPHMALYEERATALIRKGTLKFESLLALGCFLLMHYVSVGSIAKAGVLVDIIDPRTKEREDTVSANVILWRMLSAAYHCYSADKTACLDALARARKLVDVTGMHLYDIFMSMYGIMAGFIDFDRTVVDGYLKPVAALQDSGKRVNLILYRYTLGCKLIVAGNHQAALEHLEAALEMSRGTGAPIAAALRAIHRIQVLFELHRREEARICLAEIAAGNVAHCPFVYFMYCCTAAWFAFNDADEATAMLHLREAMQFGNKQRILMHPSWDNRIMTQLCSRALEAGIEPRYVRELIERHRMVPEAGHAEGENWPWPFKIYTLGRFEVVRHGERMEFSGRKQEKPLSLLKALIVHGGAEVPIDWLCDTLWPSAMGDDAYNSLKMALSRLRRLLDDDHLIEVRERKISLNRDICWVDAWAIAGIAGRIEGVLRQSESDGGSACDDVRLVNLVDEAIRLYAGEFLGGEKNEQWEIRFRNQLQHTFLAVLKKFCSTLERAERWNLAVSYYRRALETDNLSEEVYQRLMVCHHRLGQKAEAARIYRMCRTTLHSALGITPSQQTEDIFRSISKD